MASPSQMPPVRPTTAADRDDGQTPPDEVAGDLALRVAERLQRGDLRTLDRHDAGEDEVDQKNGDDEEHSRNGGADGLQLIELVVQEPVRQLLSAKRGPDAAVGLEDARRAGRRPPAPADAARA